MGFRDTNSMTGVPRLMLCRASDAKTITQPYEVSTLGP